MRCAQLANIVSTMQDRSEQAKHPDFATGPTTLGTTASAGRLPVPHVRAVGAALICVVLLVVTSILGGV